MVFPIVYFLTPFTALIQDTTTRYVVFLTIMLVKGIVVIIGFPCTTILLTNSASSLRILGTLNGFATTFSGMGRAIGPACVGAVFSWGVKNGYAIAPWWLLSLIALVGTIPPWFIVEGDGPTRSLGTDDGEEESLLPNDEDTDDEGTDDEDVALIEAIGELDSDSDSDSRTPSKRGNKSYGTLNGTSNGASR
jgi:MFS family permease